MNFTEKSLILPGRGEASGPRSQNTEHCSVNSAWHQGSHFTEISLNLTGGEARGNIVVDVYFSHNARM